MKKILTLTLVLFTVAAVFVAAEGEQEYPARDITNTVVWGAGGGTDTCNRIVSAEMAKIMGVNINVINKTGGVGGSVGMSYVYQQPHDGYTLAGVSESCVTAAVQGGWDQRMSVWDYFIIAGSPDVLSVTPNSQFRTIRDLVEYARTNPGVIKAGASAAGSIHHLNVLAFENGSGIKFNFIPYNSSADSQTAAMTGEINVVVTSVAEQQQLIRSGKLRPLAMMIPEAFTIEGIGNVPSAFTDYPDLSRYLPISQAIGFAVPADTPAPVKAKLTEVFGKAMQSDAIKKWAKDNYYNLSGQTGAAAKNTFNKLESLFAWQLWDLKAAKINPETLGIPRP